jgi:DNA-binding response OmpR family regulator
MGALTQVAMAQRRGVRVLKVLIAEDELMIADMLEEDLVKAGYEVCGIARTVPEGIALAQRHRPDLAIIDMRLADDGLGTEIAAELVTLGKPGVLFATGNSSTVMLTAADGHACIGKPYRFPDLLRGLQIVAELATTGTASPPFPRGFQILPQAATPLPEPSHG